MSPAARYGTVSQEASEITLADEPTVDLSSGGLKRKADIPFGSPVWIAETLQSTIGNAQWRADTLAQIHHEVNTAQSRASAWWAGATPEERAKAGGASGVILLILLWLFGAFSNSEEFAQTSAVAALDANALRFVQLPCFSGSCNNWMFLAGMSNASILWTDVECNAIARKFGCGGCKSPAEDALYAPFGGSVRGRVTLCPTDTPAPGRIEVMSEGSALGRGTYTAIGSPSYGPEQLRLSKLPCWASALCDIYLLESDSHNFLSSDVACNYWSAHLGCAPHCKTAAEVTADVRLQAFTTHLPPGRPKTGRVTACSSNRTVGMSATSDGITYTLHRETFWSRES
jgi:hypothetical protein